MADISIIIPAYNAEGTLSRAVQSISEKENIEIIIVENGSTDGTLQLAHSMMKDDDRIKVIQSDKGVSRARNAGINASSGKWLLFLDADDAYTEDAFEVMAGYLDTDADIVEFGHFHGTKPVPVTKIDKSFFDDIDDAKVTMIEKPTVYLTAVSKLFRRDIIIDNDLSFDTEMSVSEDSDFVLRYILKCRSIAFSKEIIYSYSVDNESTMRSYDPERVNKYMRAMHKTAGKLRGEALFIRRAFSRYMLQNVNIMMVHGPFSVGSPEPFRTKVKILKKVAKNRLVKASLKQLSLRDVRNMRLVPLFLLRYKLYLTAGLVYTIRAHHNHRLIKER